MVTKNIIRENTYLDSIMLMSISSSLKQIEGVLEVSVIMGTEANKEILKSTGLLTGEGEKARPSDLIIAVQARIKDAEKIVLEKAEKLLYRKASIEKEQETVIPKSYEAALQALPTANIAVISIPGQYAGREAMAVLESGRHVMIFSDNVPIEDEIKLKNRAKELDLLVMGPDCGTAIINGTALGFANVIRKGPIGVVGASGTGIQEVTTQIHKKGYGITQAIGVGGRDLSEEVNGVSMLQGIKALENDAATDVIILISKPPSPEVVSLIFDTISDMKKKYIVNFLKGDPEEARKRGLLFASGLEEAAELAISAIEGREFIQSAFTFDEEVIRARAEKERKKLVKRNI